MEPTQEIKLQYAIQEFLSTEKKFVRDLLVLKEIFVQPLSISNCIEHQRQDSFHKELFGNYAEILSVHQKMYRELRDWQITKQVESIGNTNQMAEIIMKYIDQLSEVYTEYGPHLISAKYLLEKEMENNPLFENFVIERSKLPEVQKLPFRHFVYAPVTRIQRFSLLLNAIIRCTTDEVEKANLMICCREIMSIANKMDALAAIKKKEYQIREINDKVQFKSVTPHFQLNLLDPERTLIHHGELQQRRSHLRKSIDLYAFLFDHVLLLTKTSMSTTEEEEESCSAYVVYRNPLPLSSLILGDTEEDDASFSICCLDDKTQDIFVADSPNECFVWKEKIELAQKQFKLKANIL